jgi:lysophospholipase L1-like esterase
MPRRWTAALATTCALVALACEGSGGAGRPTPTPRGTPTGRPVSVAALGDSVSTGFGSCLTLTSCQRNSWSTGDGSRVDSLAKRLAAGGRRVDTYNEAVPGARASGLAAQATAAVRHRADYVTVLVGANDACRDRIGAMTPVADFRAAVDGALGVLRRGRPAARVLVVSIPDLNALWAAGRRDEVARRVWARGVCPALLADAGSDAEADVRRRAAFGERVEAYDRELAAACRAYGSRCRFDGGAVHRARVDLGLVTRLDYFHPNAAGQNRLAELAWAASGWRRD